MGIGDYNWQAWSHQDLHKMINGADAGLIGMVALPSGRGVAGGTEAAEAWNRFTTLMSDLTQRTTDALARAGVGWEGQAADTAQSGITPLAQWADDAHTAGVATGDGTTELVDYYTSARNAMPEPVSTNSTANTDFLGVPAGFTHLLGGQTDQDKQERAAQEAKIEAVRVLESYRENSATTTAKLGAFVAPPNVVTAVGVTNPEVEQVQPPRDASVPELGTANSFRSNNTTTTSTGQDDSTTRPSDVTLPSNVTTEPVNRPLTPAPVAPPAATPHLQQVVSGLPMTAPGNRPPTASGGTNARRTGGGVAATKGGIGGSTESLRGGKGSGVLGGPSTSRPTAGQAGQATGAKGQSAMGLGPAGAARGGQNEEDLEHFNPDYLHDSHDEFWGAEPEKLVAPPVIGE